MSERTLNNGNIGNAVRILAPNTTWKLHQPGTNLNDLEWLDDAALKPSDSDILAKVAELDSQ